MDKLFSLKKRKKSWYVVVIGCGRLGSMLAGSLSNEGHSVVVIDNDEMTFENLPPEFTGFTICGDATSVEILKDAKIDKADIVIASTNDDNSNYMVSQLAKEIFGVKKVISRVFNPLNEGLFKEFKIETVAPMMLASRRIEEMLAEFMETEK